MEFKYELKQKKTVLNENENKRASEMSKPNPYLLVKPSKISINFAIIYP